MQAKQAQLAKVEGKQADLEEAATTLQGNVDNAKEDVAQATERGSMVREFVAAI